MCHLYFAGNIFHYGKMTISKIENYIKQTQSVLSEIDILRASYNYEAIGLELDSLKTHSISVNAQQMILKIQLIEDFLGNSNNIMGSIPYEMRLDNFMKALRIEFYNYRTRNEK